MKFVPTFRGLYADEDLSMVFDIASLHEPEEEMRIDSLIKGALGVESSGRAPDGFHYQPQKAKPPKVESY